MSTSSVPTGRSMSEQSPHDGATSTCGVSVSATAADAPPTSASTVSSLTLPCSTSSLGGSPYRSSVLRISSTWCGPTHSTVS